MPRGSNRVRLAGGMRRVALAGIVAASRLAPRGQGLRSTTKKP